jgi:hypothetical protein
MACREISCQNIDVQRVNGRNAADILLPAEAGAAPGDALVLDGALHPQWFPIPATSTGAAGAVDVADGAGSWTDSGVSIVGGAVAGAGSYATSGGFLASARAGGAYIDFAAIAAAGNAVVAYARGITNRLLVGVGVGGTEDAHLAITNNSTSVKDLTVQNVNGPIQVVAGTSTVLTAPGGITANTGATIDGSGNIGTSGSVTAASSLLVGAAATITSSVAAGGASYPLVWPSTQGGVGSVLTNDGAGNLSWV